MTYKPPVQIPDWSKFRGTGITVATLQPVPVLDTAALVQVLK